MYFINRSLLTLIVFLIIAGIITFLDIRKKRNKISIGLKILCFLDIYIFLEEKLLPFPLSLKLLYPREYSFTNQFSVQFEHFIYLQYFLMAAVAIVLFLFLCEKQISLAAVLGYSIGSLVLLILFKMGINYLCQGIYKSIDLLEELITVVGSFVGFHLHDTFLKDSRLRKSFLNEPEQLDTELEST